MLLGGSDVEMDHTASILPYTIMTSPLHHKTQRLSSQGTQGPSSPAEISFKLKGLETGPLNFSYSDVGCDTTFTTKKVSYA